MDMDLWTDVTQQMQQRPSVTLVMFASLLELPSWQLEQVMHTELANNPALELYEADICSRCGNPQNDGICYFCLQRSQFEDTMSESAERTSDAEDFDLFDVVIAPRLLAEELTEVAHTSLPKEDHFIAEYLIGGLNDNGMLDIQLGDAVRALGVTPQRVRETLEALQQLAPPGVFARDVRECLLLQLARLEAAGEAHVLIQTIIENHLEDLAKGRYTYLAKVLHSTAGQVTAARDFIRERLRPFPLLDSGESRSNQTVNVTYTRPDVIIRQDVNGEHEFTVEIIESKRFGLRISPVYRELAQTLRHGKVEDLDEAERQHIVDHVARAQQFIGHLRERHSTLERVTLCVVKHQKEYLINGVRYLTALTRLSVADEIGLHVSTVSRAVTDKYVLLPVQQVEPMRIFFEAVRNVHDVVRELIAHEDHPLSDTEIVQCLAEQGYPVARRTVAKYRKHLGILPSTLR